MKRMLSILIIAVFPLVVAFPMMAVAGPGFGNSFTIDLYETANNQPNGPPTEFHVVELPEAVTLGNVWIWETLPANPVDRTLSLFLSINPVTGELWGSDILNFFDQGAHTVVAFWSDGANPVLAPDRSANAVDFLEPANGIFTYVAGNNVYIVHSDANETLAPIPPAFILFGSGLVGLAGLRRFRKS